MRLRISRSIAAAATLRGRGWRQLRGITEREGGGVGRTNKSISDNLNQERSGAVISRLFLRVVSRNVRDFNPWEERDSRTRSSDIALRLVLTRV